MADVRLKRAERDSSATSLGRIIEIERENRDILLENRAILHAIADHFDLTLETPPQGPQPD